MIYVGYPCVGKSSISGKNGYIDLESSNFFYPNSSGELQRDASWADIYTNIAVDLHRQGYNVFLSSHGDVIKMLNDYNIEFVAIFPDKSIKEEWKERAIDRFHNNQTKKNRKALERIRDHYDEDIDSLMNTCRNQIRLYTCNYDLREVLEVKFKSHPKYKFELCVCCKNSTTGNCPMHTSKGCAYVDGKIVCSLEFFDEITNKK